MILENCTRNVKNCINCFQIFHRWLCLPQVKDVLKSFMHDPRSLVNHYNIYLATKVCNFKMVDTVDQNHLVSLDPRDVNNFADLLKMWL